MRRGLNPRRLSHRLRQPNLSVKAIADRFLNTCRVRSLRTQEPACVLRADQGVCARAAICRFIDDGRLEMTNNAAERAIHPVTLGRRNWTVLGSDAGGDRAAIHFRLIQICKLNGVNPEAYLADLIDRVGDHPTSRIDEPLPWKWKPVAA